jgi:tRNA modification GTPase
LNKIDLGEHPCWSGVEAVRISCKEAIGLDTLAEEIFQTLAGSETAWGPDFIAINARHKACLERASTSLHAARDLMNASGPPELVAEEIRAALDAIGDIVGRVDAEELLGVIFGRFCIGK